MRICNRQYWINSKTYTFCILPKGHSGAHSDDVASPYPEPLIDPAYRLSLATGPYSHDSHAKHILIRDLADSANALHDLLKQNKAQTDKFNEWRDEANRRNDKLGDEKAGLIRQNQTSANHIERLQNENASLRDEIRTLKRLKTNSEYGKIEPGKRMESFAVTFEFTDYIGGPRRIRKTNVIIEEGMLLHRLIERVYPNFKNIRIVKAEKLEF